MQCLLVVLLLCPVATAYRGINGYEPFPGVAIPEGWERESRMGGCAFYHSSHHCKDTVFAPAMCKASGSTPQNRPCHKYWLSLFTL